MLSWIKSAFPDFDVTTRTASRPGRVFLYVRATTPTPGTRHYDNAIDSGEHEDVIDDIYGEPLCPASPTGEHFCDECSHEDHMCEPIPYPCPTVRAITEALA